MSPPGRRQRLREATAALHESLDTSVSALDLTRLDDYRRFLRGNGAAVLAAETMLERANVTQCLPDWPQRARRDFIQADLRGLGMQVEALRWDRSLPNRAEMFGMVYVLEGSRLGARTLLPHVRGSADQSVNANCRFLSSQQPALWRAFLDHLESAEQAIDESAMVAAALDTFALFAHSFSLVLPPAAHV